MLFLTTEVREARQYDDATLIEPLSQSSAKGLEAAIATVLKRLDAMADARARHPDFRHDV